MTECICGWPGISYAGPEEDCPIHGQEATRDCSRGKCECPRCRCGAALDSPQCEDYHRQHPYSKRGVR